MTFAKLAPGLFSLGYLTLPAVGKKVFEDGWQAIPITADQVAHWAGNGKANCNVSIRTGDDSLGVPITLADVDIYNRDVARAVAASIVETFGQGLERRGQAPKRSFVFAQKSIFRKITSPVWVDPDGVEHRVEWLGKGQQFIAFGIHPDTKKPYDWPSGSLEDVEPWALVEVDEAAVIDWMDNVLPSLIPSDWTRLSDRNQGRGAIGEDAALINYRAPIDLSFEELRAAVLKLDADMGHDEWVKVMMAIHHQTQGSDEGLALAHEWSALSDQYKDWEVDQKWRSMHDDPSRGAIVTAATVLHMVKEEAPKRAQDYRDKFAAATTEEEWRAVVAEIKDAGGIKGIEADLVIDVAIKRMRVIAGVTLRKDSLRTELAPVRRSSTRAAPIEPWCAPYVWCQFEDCFVDADTQEAVSVMSFNARHGRDVKDRWMTPDGTQMSAVQVALHEIQIPVVARRMYLPWADQFFSQDGMDYINRFRRGLMAEPIAPEDWSLEDEEAVGLLKTHMDKLCGAESKHLIDWMAYCLQNPGRKIRHSILIKGTEGDGKSLFGTVLELAMGSPNVAKVSPKVLNSDFNGWAEGACLCVIEEMRLNGHNRFDIANALKEYHTNDTVTIHRKGLDPYKVINTQNYLMFTNYSDAVPLTDADRRYFVIFSPFTKLEELNHAGMGPDYFDTLYNAIREHTGAIAGWLMSRDLKGFNANGRAPSSLAKESMVAASTSDEDEAVMELLDRGISGISQQVICTNSLTNALAVEFPHLEPLRGRSMAVVLSRLGYSKRKTAIRWNGNVVKIWVRDVRVANNDQQVRALLNETVTDV